MSRNFLIIKFNEQLREDLNLTWNPNFLWRFFDEKIKLFYAKNFKWQIKYVTAKNSKEKQMNDVGDMKMMIRVG